MDLSNMSIKDIEERLIAIRDVEMRAEGADLEKLNLEITELEARKAELAEFETRKKEAEALQAGVVEGTIIEERKVEKEMTDLEKRAKSFVESGRTEMRAVLGTGTIVKPTKGDGINGLAAVANDIVDDVNAVALTGTGAWVVGYKRTDAIAAAVTDGSAIGGTGATFNYVTINPAEWGVLDQVSNQVKKMSPLNYLAAVEESALIALRTEASSKIVAAVKASSLTETVQNVALDADYLKNVVLGFRAIKGKGEVVLYLNAADLQTLGKVRGTAEKKAIYDITFDAGTTLSGTIKEGGLAAKFRINDDLGVGEQLFGQPKTIDMPMWDGYTIATDEGGQYFAANQIGVRGLQTAGADLVAYHGMQYITQ